MRSRALEDDALKYRSGGPRPRSFYAVRAYIVSGEAQPSIVPSSSSSSLALIARGRFVRASRPDDDRMTAAARVAQAKRIRRRRGNMKRIGSEVKPRVASDSRARARARGFYRVCAQLLTRARRRDGRSIIASDLLNGTDRGVERARELVSA